MNRLKIGFIGNPNSGKSTIFNELTGLNQKTGNWPGVTVEKKVGEFIHNDEIKVEVIDLPGLYSLGIAEKKTLDQKIAIDYINANEFDYIINIVDSTNLARSLYLTLQLLERNIPVILVLNMDDNAKKGGIHVDSESLSKILKIPIIKISAKKSRDVIKLKKFIVNKHDIKTDIFSLYPELIQKFYHEILRLLKKDEQSCENIISIMEGESKNHSVEIQNYIKNINNKIIGESGDNLDFVFVNTRHKLIKDIYDKVVKTEDDLRSCFSDKLDNIIINRYLGIPILMIVIYFIFLFALKMGGIFQYSFNLFGEATFVDIPILLLGKVFNNEFILLVIEGLGMGIQIVFSFIPIIFSMYFVLSFLEDSGYMPRAALISNRLLRALKLPAQSFFPLIVGLGCNVPSISSTRILKDNLDRINTILISPFVSCSARLAVYTLFCFVFFPNNTHNIIFFLYLLGIVMAIITGLILKNKEDDRDLTCNNIIELPNYKMPKFKTIFLSSYLRSKSFAFGAGKTIIVVFFLLHMINSIKIPTGNSADIQERESIINIVGKKIVVIFEPIGLKKENWPAGVSLITGIFAKEVVIGTLVSLYSENNTNEIKNRNIIDKYKRAILNIPIEFYELIKNLSGFQIVPENYNDFYHENSVDNHVLKNIKGNFDNDLSVLSYMIFVLLYFPCVAVFGAISNEIGVKWAIISAIWSTGSAYAISTIFFQVSNFFVFGEINIGYLFLGILLFITLAFALRKFSRYNLLS
ncbi:MAG: ferrous iron transport protein B [Candidatus Midichloriaceae bacterium]|jgi:ferrous iron transport protein B